MLDQLEEILHPGTDPAPFTLTPPAPSPLPQPDLTFRHRLEPDQVGNEGPAHPEQLKPRDSDLRLSISQKWIFEIWIFASLPNLIMGDPVYYGEV